MSVRVQDATGKTTSTTATMDITIKILPQKQISSHVNRFVLRIQTVEHSNGTSKGIIAVGGSWENVKMGLTILFTVQETRLSIFRRAEKVI